MIIQICRILPILLFLLGCSTTRETGDTTVRIHGTVFNADIPLHTSLHLLQEALRINGCIPEDYNPVFRQLEAASTPVLYSLSQSTGEQTGELTDDEIDIESTDEGQAMFQIEQIEVSFLLTYNFRVISDTSTVLSVSATLLINGEEPHRSQYGSAISSSIDHFDPNLPQDRDLIHKIYSTLDRLIQREQEKRAPLHDIVF